MTGRSWQGLLAALAAALVACSATVARAQPAAESVATGLAHPWAVAFLEDGRFLVTERPGRIRVVEADGRVGPPVDGVPPVVAAGQGGLLDLVLDSGWARNRQLYFCYAEPGAGGNSTALARARLSPDRRRLEDVQVIFRQQPKVASQLHFGCRIAEAADGTLFLALGERYSRMQDAQRLDTHHGKLVRLTKDGAAAPGNPFAGRAGALPHIWSLGHRNPQGLAFGPDGRLWLHEHGPQGGDELNLPQAGRNHGWPVITYGESYGGGPVGEGLTAREGLEQPLHHWTPSIAPSGLAVLASDRYGAGWRGSLFVGSLKFGELRRLQVQDGRVAEQVVLRGLGRVRDVRQGPDGLLYLLTDSAEGRLLRLRP